MKISFIASLLCVAAIVPAQNLLRNSGFENATEGQFGQDLMPSDWYSASSSPDTYSNDGSFGLSPSDFGNFNGVTSHGGKRWVAGWSAANEQIAQTLSAALVPGQTYLMSAWLHQAVRSDLNVSGGYDVIIGGSTVAHLGDTVSVADGWHFYSQTFTYDGGTGNVLIFNPTSTAGSSYAGLDDVSLTATPEPATMLVLGIGAVGLMRRRRQS